MKESGFIEPCYFMNINTKGLPDRFGKVPIYEIGNYYDLVKIIGELKSHFSDQNIRILLRGQRNRHGFIQLPPILRQSTLLTQIENNLEGSSRYYTPWIEVFKNKLPIQNRYSFLQTLKDELDLNFASRLFRKISPIPNMLASEPILQHYNFKTKWLDLVDSIPIALWFASQKLNEPMNEKFFNSIEDKHHYLFIYGIQSEKRIAPGIWEGNSQRLVNLAEAIGPAALRPHMQYAYSLLDTRLTNLSKEAVDPQALQKLCNCDYSKYLFCIMKIKRKDILDWLFAKFGSDYIIPQSLKYLTLFPPPEQDSFLKSLIDYIKCKPNYKDTMDFYRMIYPENDS